MVLYSHFIHEIEVRNQGSCPAVSRFLVQSHCHLPLAECLTSCLGLIHLQIGIWIFGFKKEALLFYHKKIGETPFSTCAVIQTTVWLSWLSLAGLYIAITPRSVWDSLMYIYNIIEMNCENLKICWLRICCSMRNNTFYITFILASLDISPRKQNCKTDNFYLNFCKFT